MRRAASRAAWTAGKSKAIKIPMMAMTTNNSTNVNPRSRFACSISLTSIEKLWYFTKISKNELIKRSLNIVYSTSLIDFVEQNPGVFVNSRTCISSSYPSE